MKKDGEISKEAEKYIKIKATNSSQKKIYKTDREIKDNENWQKLLKCEILNSKQHCKSWIIVSYRLAN